MGGGRGQTPGCPWISAWPVYHLAAQMVPLNYLSLGILKNVPRAVTHQAEMLTVFVTLLLLENDCVVSLVLGWWSEFEDLCFGFVAALFTSRKGLVTVSAAHGSLLWDAQSSNH